MAELGSGSSPRSDYPGTLDTDSSIESTSTSCRADVPNDAAAAIVNIQTELGTDPAGTKTDVKTYLQTEHSTAGAHETFQGPINFAADAGSNDTYVITLSPALSAYATGQVFFWTANTLNTGTCTLNVNGLGAKTIVKNTPGGVSTALDTGDILAGQSICTMYDGTNMVLLSIPAQFMSQAGTGTGRYLPSGVINIDLTAVGTDADTNEKDLMTYSLPANSLTTAGQCVRITAWGTTAANANTKTIHLAWGGTTIATTGAIALNNGDWKITGLVYMTGTATQDVMGWIRYDDTQVTNFATATEDETGAIVIDLRGQNGTASASDIVAEGMMVEYLA